MRHLKRCMWFLLLFIIATAGSIIGGILINPLCYILCHLFPKCEYICNVAKASDRLDAAYLGWDGRCMISTELANANRLLWMRDGLECLSPGHCRHSADKEAADILDLKHRVSMLEAQVEVVVGKGIAVGTYDNMTTKRRERYELNAEGDVVLSEYWWKDVVIAGTVDKCPGSSWGSYPDVI